MRTILIAVLSSLSCAAAFDWRLVWSDEFERDGLPDPARWTYEEGFVRNRELQYYTRDRRENARVERGVLIIEARRERYRNALFEAASTDWRRSREFAEYTSASLTTEGRAAWRYGRIEVRAKLPTGRGLWPAIWMLGVNRREAGWPRCGEIDIMENVGYDPEVIHANIHTEAYNHVRGTNKGASIRIERPWADFHVYALEWTPDRLDFFVDDRRYFSYGNDGSGPAAWPFDQPFYLILNVAVGGSWGGRHGVDESVLPQRMEVDYVRVYAQSSQRPPGRLQ